VEEALPQKCPEEHSCHEAREKCNVPENEEDATKVSSVRKKSQKADA